MAGLTHRIGERVVLQDVAITVPAGRFVTLTTEAVTLAAGGDRRVIGVYAFLQSLLPILAFLAAIALPARRSRR